MIQRWLGGWEGNTSPYMMPWGGDLGVGALTPTQGRETGPCILARPEAGIETPIQTELPEELSPS